jgi:rhodanese-related sulfurtransferase
MVQNFKYVVAAATLVAGLVIPEYAEAGCGSCGPAVKAAPARATSQCGKSKCKAACDKKSKACPAGGVCAAKVKSCAAGCTKPCCAKDAKEAAVIDTHTLQALLAAGTKVTVLDARSGKWDDGRRVPGAKALAADATAEKAAALIPSKESLVVTYCSNLKCPASGMLAAALKKLGYENILEYSAGIEGWAKHGNRVEQAK